MLAAAQISVFFTLFTGFTVAQVPSRTWRKPNITISIADRVAIADSALQVGIKRMGTDGEFPGEAYDQAAKFYLQMAAFDVIANQSQYHSSLLQLFNLAQVNHANFSSDVAYGYAAGRAYMAYSDPAFLKFATEAWWFGRQYTLTQIDVDSGKLALKNFTLAQVCTQGETMAGGTFQITDPADPEISANAAGFFLMQVSQSSFQNSATNRRPSLSALLAEATSDPLYLEAAEQSFKFMHTHLFGSQNVVLENISGRASDSCVVNNFLNPANSGLMIEGLAVLTSITQNSSTRALLGDLVEAAIETYQGGQGIIEFGSTQAGDMLLTEGIGSACSRNVTTADLRAFAEAFLAVQFNAIIDLATDGTSNIYANAWVGPPNPNFLAGSQSPALGVMNIAIGLPNYTVVTPPSPNGSPAPSALPSRNASSNPTARPPIVGAIIGGVVGVVAVIGLAVSLWAFRRRFWQRRKGSDAEGHMAGPEITPFPGGDLPPATVNSSSAWDATTLVRGEKHPRYRAASSSQALEDPIVPASASLPTAELVRMLNQRLQSRDWDEAEAPPDYALGRGH